MIDDWEEFSFGASNPNGDLHVTIDRKGTILIGTKTFEAFGRPDHVVLLFSRSSSKIGIVPSNQHAKNSYVLKTRGPNHYRVITANRFCRHYGIKVDRTVAFVEPKIDADRMLVLDLKQTRVIGKPRKTAATQ
jgi:hypothetical protein